MNYNLKAYKTQKGKRLLTWDRRNMAGLNVICEISTLPYASSQCRIKKKQLTAICTVKLNLKEDRI